MQRHQGLSSSCLAPPDPVLALAQLFGGHLLANKCGLRTPAPVGHLEPQTPSWTPWAQLRGKVRVRNLEAAAPRPWGPERPHPRERWRHSPADSSPRPQSAQRVALASDRPAGQGVTGTPGRRPTARGGGAGSDGRRPRRFVGRSPSLALVVLRSPCLEESGLSQGSASRSHGQRPSGVSA